MNVVFQMLINCPYKIGYTLWCNTWNLLKSYHLFETQYLMHMKTSHGIYTLLEGSNVMDMKNDFPSSVCFFDLFIFVNWVKTNLGIPNNWWWSIDSLPLGSIMCIFVNRRKGPSTSTQTNTHTYRTELNNLKRLPARLAFFNMIWWHLLATCGLNCNCGTHQS